MSSPPNRETTCSIAAATAWLVFDDPIVALDGLSAGAVARRLLCVLVRRALDRVEPGAHRPADPVARAFAGGGGKLGRVDGNSLGLGGGEDLAVARQRYGAALLPALNRGDGDAELCRHRTDAAEAGDDAFGLVHVGLTLRGGPGSGGVRPAHVV